MSPLTYTYTTPLESTVMRTFLSVFLVRKGKGKTYLLYNFWRPYPILCKWMLSHQMQSSLATYDISIRMLKNNGKLSNKVQISLGPTYTGWSNFFSQWEGSRKLWTESRISDLKSELCPEICWNSHIGSCFFFWTKQTAQKPNTHQLKHYKTRGLFVVAIK